MKSSSLVALMSLWVLLLAEPAGAEEMRRPEDIVSGKCFLCHGMLGENTTELTPRLAGQHPRYLEKQLKDFRDGRRTGSAMAKMAVDLRDVEIAGLAAYFGMQKPGRTAAADVALATAGRTLFLEGDPGASWPSCASCHGARGAGTETLPRLAGQLPGYLALQLKNFGNRARSNDNEVMHVIAERLSAAQIAALAAYLGALE